MYHVFPLKVSQSNELGSILDELVEMERESQILREQIKLIPAPTNRHNALINTFFNGTIGYYITYIFIYSLRNSRA